MARVPVRTERAPVASPSTTCRVSTPTVRPPALAVNASIRPLDSRQSASRFAQYCGASQVRVIPVGTASTRDNGTTAASRIRDDSSSRGCERGSGSTQNQASARDPHAYGILQKRPIGPPPLDVSELHTVRGLSACTGPRPIGQHSIDEKRPRSRRAVTARRANGRPRRLDRHNPVRTCWGA